jgi:sulfur carrier protein ThiS
MHGERALHLLAPNGSYLMEMTATLKLHGPLKDYASGQAQVSVPSGQSIRQALIGLGVPPELVALTVVNEEPRSKDYLLQPGDVVRLMAVLGGG